MALLSVLLAQMRVLGSLLSHNGYEMTSMGNGFPKMTSNLAYGQVGHLTVLLGGMVQR